MTGVVRTTCPYCGVGCGVIASQRDGRVEITGDPTHPANGGRLCSKGSALAETVGLEDRLLYPSIRGRRVSWDDALTHVADGFTRIVREHGSGAVAFYVSGQLLTEDYYVANKLMKGFIGTANIDTNSRLCMASAVAGHKRAFGADAVPCCYEDLELADLVVLVGSNAAWCHPVLYQRIAQAKERRPGLKVVVIDPRRTPTCEIASLHLPVRSGTDVLLFAGLLAYLHQHGHTNEAFVRNCTADAAEALAIAQQHAGDLNAVASTCGLEVARLLEFYESFARTDRVVTAFSQGVNQSSAGTDKVNSIINCHLLTGRIGQPGMGPFSITGQPNAMGGREVGGLANVLAAHLEVTDPEHQNIAQEFWNSPTIATSPGSKAVDLFEAIHAGRIRAVWIMATNPVVSLPEADRVREALQRCELVVMSECVSHNDTTAFAHVLLPAAAWGEKDGTVTNSERRISRQRAFLPLPGEARPDWWIISEVGRRMGFGAGFAYDSPHQIFDEHARLSGFRNDGRRAFDIGGLAGLTREGYDALEPIQWPVRAARAGTERLGVDGRFYHPDGRARFVATPPRGPANAPDEAFPLVLNTGRVRDQWHTMTRTGRAPRLSDHTPEPFVDMHAQDALRAGVRAGELARVITRWGSLVARLRTSGEMARGSIFVPIHWSATNASDARVGALVNPAVDAISGEPEFKNTPARVESLTVEWYGVLYLHDDSHSPHGARGAGGSNGTAPDAPRAPDVTWWIRVRGEGFLRYELAGRDRLFDRDQAARAGRERWLRELLGIPADGEYLEYDDAASGIYRAAYLVDNRLIACAHVSMRPELPSREWLAGLLGKKSLDDMDRLGLLAGRPLEAGADVGPLVCSCFRVGRNTIADAIRRHGLKTAAQVGARLKAGTHCGSCLPEIGTLLAAPPQ